MSGLGRNMVRNTGKGRLRGRGEFRGWGGWGVGLGVPPALVLVLPVHLRLVAMISVFLDTTSRR